MITNEVQYRSTKAHLRQFDEAAATLEEKLAHADEPALARLELDAVRAQADDLRAEIDEYEQLRSGAVSVFEAPTLAELAPLLVKSRIARGWTQGQLPTPWRSRSSRSNGTSRPLTAPPAWLASAMSPRPSVSTSHSEPSCAIPMPHDGLPGQRTSTLSPSAIASIVRAPAAIPTTDS